MDMPLLRRQHPGAMSATLRTGASLAVTVVVFYTLCTLVWVVAPGPFLGFMNSLFHGIDFAPLVRQAGFSWNGSLEALAVMFVWSLFAGMFFASVRERLGG